MKKRIAVVLALLVCVTCFITLFATGTSAYSEGTVAVIGSKEYSNLQDALDEAKEGSTIEIVADINDSSTPSYFVETSVNIKGNNHTINCVVGGVNSYGINFSGVISNVEDLTVISNFSGIGVKDSSQVTLKNVNVYAGGTTADATATSGNDSYAVGITNTTKAVLVIDGGTYKAYQKSVVLVTGGVATIKGGNFIGENCEFVVRVNNNTAIANGGVDTTECWIYGGTFLKPVSESTKEGGIVRADREATVTIYDGEFATYQNGGTNKREFSLLGGESGNTGNLFIFGGKYYLLNSESKGQSIGNYGAAATVGERVNAYLYGGTFYSVKDTDDNIKNATCQKLAASDYTVTSSNVTETYRETSYNFIKTVYQYNCGASSDAPASAKVKVTQPDTSVFYTDTLWNAVNGIAKDGATITLLDNITLSEQLDIRSRSIKLTVDGNGKKIVAGAGITSGAILFKNGELILNNVTVENASGPAIEYGTEFSSGVSLYTAVLTVKDSTLASSSSVAAILENDIREGSITVSNTSVNGTVTNDTKTFVYDLPTDTDDTDDTGDTDDTDDTGTSDTGAVDTGSSDTGTSDTGTVNTGSSTTGTTASTSDEKESGCKSTVGIGAVAMICVVASLAVVSIRKKAKE